MKKYIAFLVVVTAAISASVVADDTPWPWASLAGSEAKASDRDNPGDYLFMEDGKLILESVEFVSNGCYSAGTATQSTPDSVPRIANAISITLPIEFNGSGFCTMAVQFLKYRIEVTPPPPNEVVNSIIVYRLDMRSATVSGRALTSPNAES